MLKGSATLRQSASRRMTRVVLSAAVAVAGFVSLEALSQVQSFPVFQGTMGPGRVIDSLDAVPQISAAELAAPRLVLPFLSHDDPVTFAANKAAAKAMRFELAGVTPSSPPVPLPGKGGELTVSPLELQADATSDASCGTVSGEAVEPPDQALAVGDTTIGVVQAVNICLSVYDKSGNLQSGYPKSTNAFFGLGALNDTDPRLIYDWINHRYIYVVVAYPSSCTPNCATAAYYELAVSNGDSPTGAWCLYTNIPVFTKPNPQGGVYLFPDFPRLGQDRQAIYIASNIYSGNTFIGEEVAALRKSDLYTCSGYTYEYVSGNTFNGFTLQPASVYSSSDQPKSMYFVTSFSSPSKQLVISAFHDPFGTPTFTQLTINGTNTYSLPPNATQKGTTNLINTDDQRIGASAFYAAGSIYAALTTNGGSGEPAIIMYQIQPFVDTTGTSTDGQIIAARILNETLIGSGSNAWYYPAQIPDPEGNVLTVFGFSNSTTYASLAYASRRAAQTPGSWPDNGFLISSPTSGSYTGGRWGDYSATAPAGLVSGGGTGGFPKFWFAGQYAKSSGDWGTTIGRSGFTIDTQD